jgi:hypothetical protein
MKAYGEQNVVSRAVLLLSVAAGNEYCLMILVIHFFV